MDAMGKDVILVETVGVGQDEIEIASLAHTVVVVAVPGMGDDVQAIKAGVMEIADLFAVNKADREGSERTVRDLQGMLELRRIVQPSGRDPHHGLPGSGMDLAASEHGAFADVTSEAWEPPIVRTVALTGQGIEELAKAIDRHLAHLVASGEKARRDVSRARAAFVAILRERLLAGALARLELELGKLEDVAERIAARQADPYQLAEELASRVRGTP
jgi:LAO/AO transport system kinase